MDALQHCLQFLENRTGYDYHQCNPALTESYDTMLVETIWLHWLYYSLHHSPVTELSTIIQQLPKLIVALFYK